jgi:hypothetical protein
VHVWAEVLRYGLEIVESPRATTTAWLTGGKRRTGLPSELDAAFDMIGRVLSKADQFVRPYDDDWYKGCEALDSLNVRQAIEQAELSREEADIVSGALSSLASASCAEAGLLKVLHWYALSYRDRATFFDTLARFKFRDGTKSLIDAMIAEAKPHLMLSTPVAQIRHDENEVVITAQDGRSFTARAAVIALPMNVLKDIQFFPELIPGKLAASQERHAGHGVKSWSLVSGVPDTFFGVGDAPLTWLMTEYQVPEGQLMVGFGPDGKSLNPAALDGVEAAVKAFLPNAKVLAIGGHDWLSDPYSQGVWCVFKPMQVTRYLADLRRPQGRLIFAGSDTATAWSGFISGAIESGIRAGREVSRLLGA